MKKRLSAVLLAVCLALTLLPATAFAENETVDTGWYNTTDAAFTLDDKAELLGFASIVNGTADGIAQDSFQNKTVTLGSDMDLAGIDRIHQQSISVQALIFTKDHSGTISRTVMQEMGRGVTYWEGAGAYTDEPSRILCTCISRYEQEQLERIVKATDPHAFIITIPGVHIDGNFIHKV